MSLPESILVKRQKREFCPRDFGQRDSLHRPLLITAFVRWDDECGNGHNSFSITGKVEAEGARDWEMGGCIHDEIAKFFPELAPLIKYHMMGSDGPMHYVANTVHHADAHGPTHAWVYYTGSIDPRGIGGVKERLVGYSPAADAAKVDGQPGYRVVWDEKTAKVRNLDHARSCAVWPEATDEELTLPRPVLAMKLRARLPALMEEFKAAITAPPLSFVY